MIVTVKDKFKRHIRLIRRRFKRLTAKLGGHGYNRHGYNEPAAKTIALLGLAEGLGTSHTSQLLANYYANYYGYSVALVGPGGITGYKGMKDLTHNEKLKKKVSGLTDKGYSFNAVDIYFGVNCRAVDALRKVYDIVIVDYSDYLTGRSDWNAEFNTCLQEACGLDRLILVGSLALHRFTECRFRMDSLKDCLDNMEYRVVSLSYNESLLQDFSRRYGIKVTKLPYEPDPYVIHGSNVKVIEELCFNQLP